MTDVDLRKNSPLRDRRMEIIQRIAELQRLDLSWLELGGQIHEEFPDLTDAEFDEFLMPIAHQRAVHIPPDAGPEWIDALLNAAFKAAMRPRN